MLIAGPTASGKSALALALAQETGGVVINADSMQVYRDLRVITARPTRQEEALVPHRLYGHVDAAVNFSAGALGRRMPPACWRRRSARSAPADLRRRFRPLLQGADARAVGGAADPAEMRERVRARLRTRRRRGAACRAGAARSAIAERLKPRDRTRIARALEVVEATGRSLTDWHREGLPPLLARRATAARCFSRPSAIKLYAPDRCAVRRDAGGRRAGRGARRSPRGGSIRCCRR